MSPSKLQESFLDEVRPHQGMLRRIAAVYADSFEDRRDLLQEMLLQLWRSYPGYRGDAKFSTWMHRVALNTALLGWRRRSRRPEGHLSADDRVLDNLPGIETDDEAVRELYAAIRALPGVDRAIVALWLEGHSYSEIAAIIGLRRSNVSVRLVRLKEKLRASFEDRPELREVQ